jgi:ABC-2 type transport system permease protein
MSTLPLRAEVARQLTRRRTQLSLGLLVLLPLILVAAFQLGSPGGGDGGSGTSLADIATSGGANFTLFTVYVASGFLLLVLICLYCGDTVASEASWGTLRYLLAAPVPRGRLLRQKLIVGLGCTAVAFTLLPAVAMVAGTIAFGWEPLRTQVGAEIPPWAALVRIALAVLYVGISLLPAGAIAFYLSVRTDAPLGAVGGAVMLWIVSFILDAVTALGDLRVILPTHYSSAWLALLSDPVQVEEMAKGCLSALVYTTVFLALAWRHFLRKDIVS